MTHHINVVVQDSPRAPRRAVVTVDSESPTYRIEIDAACIASINKARAEGRDVPIISVDRVEHA